MSLIIISVPNAQEEMIKISCLFVISVNFIAAMSIVISRLIIFFPQANGIANIVDKL